MEVIYTDTPEKDAGNSLSDIFSKYKNEQILLLMSGGSAFSLLDYFDLSLINPNTTLGLIDERFSTNPNISNYIQLTNTKFFQQAIANRVKKLDFQIKQNDTLESTALRWDYEIKNWINNNPNGKIIATLGIGEDGHTAGIMPGTYEVNFNSDKLALGYTVPKEINQYTERITTTYTFLKKINNAIVYAVGPKKTKIINLITNNESNATETPSYIFKEMQFVKIFTNKI